MYKFQYDHEKQFVVTQDTVTYTPHTFDVYNGIYEPKSIHYFFSEVVSSGIQEPVIVDIGAQTGLYTLYAKFLPKATFYAFEPLPLSFQILKSNVEINKIQNVKLFNYGLGEKEEIKYLHVPDHLGLNTFGDTPKRFSSWKDVEVKVTTLDTVFKDSPVHFIKCDTEGWEYYVLMGGLQTIKKHKPDLMLEVNDANLNQCGLVRDDILKLIDSLGYTLKNIIDDENYYFTCR